VELEAPPEAAGQRLDRYLAPHAGSRAQAARWIELGAVRIAGRAAAKSRVLAGGERIVVDLPPEPPPDPGEPVALVIAYEDADMLVVDKPAGLVVHPAAGHAHGTLSQLLAARGAAGGEAWRPGIVHRLDKDTSGLLVVAKSDEAHRALKRAIALRLVVREYLALVSGRPPARAGTIDAPLGRDLRLRRRMSIATATPREARTHFTLEESLPSSTLLRVRLETGRTHQIRAHFRAIGHPLCGDRDYGGTLDFGLERQFLHATRLELEQPRTGKPLEFHSPLPADLAQALERARRA
jgi:23S rRNA pseudouridine1911/1915/1917 synthase